MITFWDEITTIRAQNHTTISVISLPGPFLVILKATIMLTSPVPGNKSLTCTNIIVCVTTWSNVWICCVSIMLLLLKRCSWTYIENNCYIYIYVCVRVRISSLWNDIFVVVKTAWNLPLLRFCEYLVTLGANSNWSDRLTRIRIPIKDTRRSHDIMIGSRYLEHGLYIKTRPASLQSVYSSLTDKSCISCWTWLYTQGMLQYWIPIKTHHTLKSHEISFLHNINSRYLILKFSNNTISKMSFVEIFPMAKALMQMWQTALDMGGHEETLDISQYHTARYRTQYTKCDDKTSVRLGSRDRNPYITLTDELWVSLVSYKGKIDRDMSGAQCTNISTADIPWLWPLVEQKWQIQGRWPLPVKRQTTLSVCCCFRIWHRFCQTLQNVKLIFTVSV